MTVDQRFVKALAHELRVEILAIFTERIASPNEISKELDEGISQVSYHVKVLKDYECITLVKTEPRRGAVEHYYRATAETLLPAKRWRDVRGGARTAIGAGLASQLFDGLADAVAANRLADSHSHVSRVLVNLDAKGLRKVSAMAERFIDAVEEEHRASVARAAKATGSTVGVTGYTVGLLAFEDSRDVSSKPQRDKAVKSTPKSRKRTTAKSKRRRASRPSGK